MQRALESLSVGRLPYLLLLLLCLGLYLPGITSLPPLDRDESRYLQASRQMLETGNFVQIRFQDEARNKKPAGVYWLQAAAMALSGDPDAAWPARLVSVLGATLAVLLTFGFGRLLIDRPTALLAASLLAVTADLVFEAHVATTDAVLLPSAVAAEGALGLAYLSGNSGRHLPRGTALAFWLAQGAALLIKGPVVALLSLLTAAALVIADRRGGFLRLLRPVWGIPLALAMVAPWLVLIEWQTGGAFLRESVGHDLLGKVEGAQEAHGAWPGYYLALLPVTFWPTTLFLGPASIWLWRRRRTAEARFLAAWIIPFWVVLELVPTKLPHYVLPLYPALALAAALGLTRIAPPTGAWVWVERGFVGLFVLLAGALVAALLGLPTLLGLPIMLVGAAGAAGMGGAMFQVMVTDHRRARLAAVPHAITVALFLAVLGIGWEIPALDPLWLTRNAAAMVDAARRPGEIVAATGYAEPSLVFALGTDTRMLVAPVAAGALARHAVGLALVEAGDDAEFRAELARQGAAVQSMGSAGGFDYSNGKWLTLRLYRLRSEG